MAADPICNERGCPESECPAYCLHAHPADTAEQENAMTADHVARVRAEIRPTVSFEIEEQQ